MKKYILFIALAVAVVIANPVFAVATAPNLSTTISGADKLISSRIVILDNWISRINSTQKLTDAQKTNLVSIVQDQINALNALKTKIGADKTIKAVQDDLKTMSGSAVYPLIVKRISIISAGDRALETTTILESLGTKFQTRITALPEGATKTSAQKLYTDFGTKIADAKIQAQSAIDAVLALKTADKTALKSARDKIALAKKDIADARKIAGEIAKSLKTP